SSERRVRAEANFSITPAASCWIGGASNCRHPNSGLPLGRWGPLAYWPRRRSTRRVLTLSSDFVSSSLSTSSLTSEVISFTLERADGGGDVFAALCARLLQAEVLQHHEARISLRHLRAHLYDVVSLG